MTGKALYERWCRHEPDALNWNWLTFSSREFWERLAAVAGRTFA